MRSRGLHDSVSGPSETGASSDSTRFRLRDSVSPAGTACKGRQALGAYLVRRFGLMLMTLFGISVLIFVLLRLTPANTAQHLSAPAGYVPPAEKKKIEHDLGLDKSIPLQYADWIGGL